jgi:hypothetical protein
MIEMTLVRMGEDVRSISAEVGKYGNKFLQESKADLSHIRAFCESGP